MVVIVETIACSEAATTSTATTSTAQPVTAGSSHSPTEILTKPVVPPSHFYQLPAEKEAKLRTIYNRLDVDKDGTVDIRDLSLALKEIPHIPDKYLPRLWERLDRAKEDKVDFAEFVHYVLEHEKHLAIVFKDLDRNQDGLIDVRELRSYCQRLGLTVSDEQAALVVKRMGQAGSATIDIYEFQDYMLLCPSTDPLDIADFWRHNLVIDIGDDTMIPEDFSQKEIQSGVWWRHLVAGAVAGCMSRTCTAPLDRIKVFLQVHANRENKLRVMSAIRYLMKEGGVSSFWRGNGINVAKIAPESAIKFMAYEQIKRLIRKNNADGELAIGERFIAGSTAGAISQTVIYPMEVLKTRLALRKTGEMARGLLHFAQRLYETEGLQCFYRGYVPNLIGIIPYAGIDLAIYETLKANYVKRHEGLTEPGVLALLACGTCSSTCGQLASYPLALVRTRLQALGISNTPNQPNTMVGQFKYILSTEGVTGLYRGITPNFMKVVPAVGISYVVYETVRKRLGASMS